LPFSGYILIGSILSLNLVAAFQALLEFLPGIMDAFINFAAGQVVEILSGFLDIMVGILELDENFAASISQGVISMVIACFVKYNADPVICPTIEDIVGTLCKNKQCVESLQMRFTPALASVLNSRSADAGKLAKSCRMNYNFYITFFTNEI
jgi:hypothetical protein